MGLTKQLWLLLLIPIALALGLNAFLAHQSRRGVLQGEASAELRNHVTFVEASLATAIDRGQMDVLEQRLERLASADRILGIAVFGESGASLLVTQQLRDAKADLGTIAAAALASGEDVERSLTLRGNGALVRASPVTQASGRRYVILVVRDLRYLDALSRDHHRGLLATGVMLLTLTALVVGLVGRATVGKPAGTIVEAAERVARGDLAARVPEEGAEELARLARSFNAMTASLREARARAELEGEARLATERKLQHIQALAAAGQVAASLGHEIGSPLNVILGRARRAAEQLDCPESLRAELITIAAQSERISRVVARLLAIARPPRQVGRGCDMRQVAEDTLAFLATESRQRRVAARLDAPDGTVRVALDGDRAFQVVFNLCLNAVQAQRDGGELIVRLTRGAPGTDDPSKVVLEVEDRGPGIAPDVAEHVFEAFFTSKGDRGGTGLGLAIVSGIVRDAGGSVDLVPRESGACFRVVLPADVARERMLPREERA